MLSLPTTFTITPSVKNPLNVKVEISPLYPGFGQTVGNALRRVLLSSLEGAGVTSVKIEGADHEFMCLPHIKEEMLEIILNIKKLHVKILDPESVKEKIVLEIKGKKDVTAGDFTPNSNVLISNAELPIATLTHKDAYLRIDATVTKGLGFSPLEEREKELEIGVIAIDTLYSPIQTVGYKVENIRVGKRTDYDRLILQITTNGTLPMAEAIKEASKILINHFDCIYTQFGGGLATAEVLEETAVKPAKKPRKPKAKKE